jgi:hypothetical protein
MKPFLCAIYLPLITVAWPLGNIALLEFVSDFVAADPDETPYWCGLIFAPIALVISWVQTLAIAQIGRIVGHCISS